jgi:hypothetical protein
MKRIENEQDDVKTSFSTGILEEVNRSGRSKVLVAHLRKLWPDVPRTDRATIHRLIEEFAGQLRLCSRFYDLENWSLARRVEFFRSK